MSLEGRADPGAFVGTLRRGRPGRERVPRQRGAVAPAAGAARLPAAHLPGRPDQRRAGRCARPAAAPGAPRWPSSRPVTASSRRSTRAATGTRIRRCCERCFASSPRSGSPSSCRRLHRRAARWFADRDAPLDAHSPRGRGRGLGPCGRPGRAALAAARSRAARAPRCASYVERIPEQVVGADAELALAAAGLHFEAGRRGGRRRPPGHRVRAAPPRCPRRGACGSAPPRRPRLCIARARAGTWTPR